MFRALGIADRQIHAQTHGEYEMEWDCGHGSRKH